MVVFIFIIFAAIMASYSSAPPPNQDQKEWEDE